MCLFVPSISMAAKEEKVEAYVISDIKKTGVVGEVFTYEVRLLSSSPEIADVRVARAVQFPSDLKVVSGIARLGRPESYKYKGKDFYSWVIKRDFLSSSVPGKFKIPKSEYVVFIPQVTGYYTDFWGRHQVVDYKELRLECKENEFKVSDLPADRSGAFSGCVGDFEVEGWFPPGKIVTGREAYVVFHISGFGSLANLSLPNINGIFKDGCRLKEIEQSDQQTQRDGRLFSEVTLTCRFVPESEDFKIDPLCLVFYSPTLGKYVEKCSESLHWTSKEEPVKKKSSSKGAIEI